MKRLLLALGALAFAAGCSSNSTSTTPSGSTGKTTAGTATTTATTGTTSTSTTTAASSSGSTGRNTVGSTSGSAASSGSTSGSTGGSGSSGSTGDIGSTGTVTCNGPGVANDACTGSIALALDTPITGDTTPAKQDFTVAGSTPGCSSLGYTGNDLTYTFTAPATAPFVFTVTPPTPTDGGSGTLDPVIDVVGTCASGTVSSCLASIDQGASGTPETLVMSLTQGQTVTVIVGAYSCTSNGPFTITVHQNPAVPANDLCASALALTSTDGGYFTASGDTTSANDELSGSCGGSPGGDVFYSFTVAQPSLLTATVTPSGAAAANDGGGYYPVVYVRDGCDPTDGGNSAIEEGCNLASTAGLSASLQIPRLAPGNYIAVVDGASTAGTFDLVLTLGTPPPVPGNDTCSAPAEIRLTPQVDGGFAGATDFTTVGANDDYQPEDGGNCFPYVSGPDVTFHATLPTATASFTASYIYPDGGTDQGTVSLIARSTPCATGPELNCSAGPVMGTATSTDLYIIVDDARGGPYAAGSILVTSP